VPQIPGVPDHGVPGEVDRPEPVLSAAKLGGLVAAVVTAVGGTVALIVAGKAGDVNALGLSVGAAVTAVVALVAYVAPVWQAHKARRLVTPLESPRNSDGVPLMAVPGLSQGPK
jgi:hypothetical protein